mmetsp:Transcript_41805/g.96827  ORF Transcript_41805/g.96827 Transcript_41805/m.96827 type:complete len:222 (-) Transcript_41805:1335-2000(-)
MLGAQLESHGDVAHTIILLALHEALHHLSHVWGDDARHNGWGVYKALGEFDFLDLLLQDAPDEFLEILLLLCGELPVVFLLLVRRGIQVELEVFVGRVHRDELLVLESLNAVHHVLVNLLVHEEHVPLALQELLHVGRGECCIAVRARKVVDVLLPLLGGRNVLLQGQQLPLGLVGALEPEELQDVVLVAAEVALFVFDNASLQIVGIALEELVVLCRVLL